MNVCSKHDDNHNVPSTTMSTHLSLLSKQLSCFIDEQIEILEN